ncbi:MAG TPA: aldo/keto reductase, partial [Bradyrhizobium sp.]
PVARGRIKSEETLVRIGQTHGKTAAQVCLRWLVQQNVAAIPRTSRMQQISQLGSAKGRLTDFGFAPKWD